MGGRITFKPFMSFISFIALGGGEDGLKVIRASAPSANYLQVQHRLGWNASGGGGRNIFNPFMFVFGGVRIEGNYPPPPRHQKRVHPPHRRELKELRELKVIRLPSIT